MRTLKVMMAYCGTRYHGYQRQNNANTVQAVVEAAVSKLLNTPTVIAGCSRTDTGVHAEQFCFSLTTENPIPCRNFVRGLNGYLPEDISILSCEEVRIRFMHGFAVRRKHIATGFTTANRKIRLPLTERYIIGVLCGLTRCRRRQTC